MGFSELTSQCGEDQYSHVCYIPEALKFNKL